MIKNISNLGDAALYCDFGNEINKEINTNVISFFKTIQEQNIKGITNLAPSYNKLIISFDLDLINFSDLKKEITKIKVLKTSVSALQDLQSGSFGLVTGGTISYTPRPSSTYVYYEFNTMLSYKDTPYATAQFRLRYGPDTSNLASINTNDIHYTIYMGSDGESLSYEQEDMIPLKLSFD